MGKILRKKNRTSMYSFFHQRNCKNPQRKRKRILLLSFLAIKKLLYVRYKQMGIGPNLNWT